MIRMQLGMYQAYLIDLVAVFDAIFVQWNMLENIMFFEKFLCKKTKNKPKKKKKQSEIYFLGQTI